MTSAVSLRTDAQRDFYRVLAHYEAEAPRETERFVNEFFAVAQRLSDFPYSSPELRRGARRANLRVFPYQLWYRVSDDAGLVEIIALLHHRQDPEQLSDRLDPRN